MNRKAFTLLELIIVVIIIAILATFAMPLYQTVKFKVRGAEAMQVVRAASDSAWYYCLANGELPGGLASIGVNVQSRYFEYRTAIMVGGGDNLEIEGFDLQVWTLYSTGKAPPNTPITYGCIINQQGTAKDGTLGQELGKGYYRHFFIQKVSGGSLHAPEYGPW